ncbi:hypothetical protein M758_1G302400 [Ceratodon purpureus]|uniref:Uncharacterized protein n=1 Tax=Ceratodon purpureus TaxID=3225 RepID=A0A8T0JE93_CERPU|nr:hypothetical protein KC19_1G308600 [Ceratodon purpureus]KAG0632081.1 hypothetical protein M758_1G302400 [Ceratodon purpureus]
MANGGESATWRMRTEAQDAVLDLSLEEKDYLSVIEKNYSGNVEKYVKFVEDIMELLRNWPQFFASRELCGEKVHAAILTAVCQSLILGALFAGVSITPLFSTPQNLADWKSRTHGSLWSLLLMLNIATIGSSALFLFHLLGCPPQLGWVWMCNIGPFLFSTPFVLMSVSAPLSFAAISCSAWFIYGRVVGILTTLISGILVLFGTYLTVVLGTRHLKTLHTGRVATGPPGNRSSTVNGISCSPVEIWCCCARTNFIMLSPGQLLSDSTVACKYYRPQYMLYIIGGLDCYEAIMRW